MIEITSFKTMLSGMEDEQKEGLRKLFEIFSHDCREMEKMLRESSDMLLGVFPWTRDVSEMSHRARLRIDKVYDFTHERSVLLNDLLEAVR